MLVLLPMPVQLPFWAIGGFDVTREILHSRIGTPHYIETDGLRTFGGEEDWWAFVNDDGQRLMVCLQAPYKKANLYADPPDCVAAESALARAIGNSEYRRYEPEPWFG